MKHNFNLFLRTILFVCVIVISIKCSGITKSLMELDHINDSMDNNEMNEHHFNGGNEGEDMGAIIGAVLGGISGLVGIAFTIYVFCRRRRMAAANRGDAVQMVPQFPIGPETQKNIGPIPLQDTSRTKGGLININLNVSGNNNIEIVPNRININNENHNNLSGVTYEHLNNNNAGLDIINLNLNINNNLANNNNNETNTKAPGPAN